MTSDVKSSLKQVRALLDQHDNKLAYELSKAILRVDDGNYHAYVFLGISAQGLGFLDEALCAFKKATTLKPDDLLAWKGLSNFCEKNEQYKSSKDLEYAYEMIIKLQESDRGKQFEVATKLAALYEENGNVVKCAEILHWQANFPIDEEAKYRVYCRIIHLFSVHPSSTEEYIALVDDSYKFVLNSKFLNSDEQAHLICKKYLLHIRYFKKWSVNECVAESRRIFMLLPNFLFPLEFLCKLFVQAVIEKEYVNITEIDELLTDLTLNNCKSFLINMTFGIKHFLSGNYVESVKMFKQDENEDWIEINILLASAQLKLHNYSGAQRAVQFGLQKIKSSLQENIFQLKMHFFVILGESLLGQRLFDYALKTLKKSEGLFGKMGDIMTLQCKTYIAMNNLDDAEMILSENRLAMGEETCIFLEGDLLLCRKEYQEAEKKFLKCLDFQERSPLYYKIGVAKWEQGDLSIAVSCFVKDINLDPFFGRNYFYLGHFYSTVKDTRKALECYKKAYELNTDDDEVGKAYSDILLKLGDKEMNLLLLKSMREKNAMNSPVWLWLRLGVIQMQMADYVSAIASLQNALQLDYTNVHCWECLGDAYLLQGSYNAAYKAFSRVYSLLPNNIFPLFRMASIKQSLGYFEDAIAEYRKILTFNPDYIPTLKGLAETLILQGKKFKEEFLFDLAKDYCLQAVNVLAKICKDQSHLSCLWKLIGDACHIISKMGNHHFPIAFPTNLVDLLKTEGNESLEKGDVLALCTSCYLKAASVNSNISGFWHDLGVSYLDQAEWSLQPGQKASFAQKALLCLQHAVSLEPNKHEYWTSLGIIAIFADQNYALAQHAFIRSVMVDNNNSKAWSSLGILYLLNENIKLAHDALSTAQSLEPADHIPWIGQALIAEKESHYETLNLFRHATVLGNHREAFLGYAHWICRVLQDKELEKNAVYNFNVYKKFALPAAADGLIKYTANDRTCKVSFCLLTELLERMDIDKMALSSASHAVSLHNHGSNNNLPVIVRRFARLLRKLGRYEEALKQCQSVASSDVGILCEQALILFLNGDFLKSQQVYEKVLKNAPDEEVASHILVAVAMTSRKLKDTKNAKTLLFQSFQKKSPSVYGFMALCALGLLENDPPLVMAAVNELQPYRKDPRFCVVITHLLSCQFAQKGDVVGNLRQYSKAIHDQPNAPELWMSMAQAILMWQPWKTKYAVNCAMVATCHGSQLDGMSLLVTLCHLLAGNINSSHKAAQKSVHMQPDSASSWSTFLSSLIAKNPDNVALPKIFKIAHIFASNQKKLESWLKILEAFMYMSKGNMTSASNLLKSVLENTIENSSVLPAAHLLVGLTDSLTEVKLSALSTVVNHFPNVTFGWLALVRLQIIRKEFDSAEICIRHWLQVMGTLQLPNYFKVTPLLLMALLALEAFKKTDKKEKWLTLSQEAVSEVLKLDPSCQVALFIRALTALANGNTKLVTSSFKRIAHHGSTRGEEKWIEKVVCKELSLLYSSKGDAAKIKMLLEQAEERNSLELVKTLKALYSKYEKKDEQ